MNRAAALLALAIPVAAGLAFMATQGAPSHYLAINGGCLLIALGLVAFVPHPKVEDDVAAVILTALLFMPFFIGPEINGVHRWIGSGPIGLNSALLALPALAVFAARMEWRPRLGLSLAALAAAVVQPDASLALAVGGAAIGVALATRDTKPALVAIAGLLAAIWAHKRGLLPPQAFVEQVYLDAAAIHPLWLVLLVVATIVGIVLIALDRSIGRPERFALAGAMTGFVYTAAISSYPTPLVGYSAAPILGLAIALWLARRAPTRTRDEDPAAQNA
ncbi:hypothetical protein [Pseudoblastomonas halimionae]|uniref:Cell wall polymerase n=1 Tax=Alteriqipengyuania halimionae TaxID=1926630 RepID=A0A6I4U4K2_9SPHN|nr:hypothetical protein [Alteriqipengyuania halimionae]MXP09855.1 hypothetical protein [Alteriqipengyuania halimionae]